MSTYVIIVSLRGFRNLDGKSTSSFKWQKNASSMVERINDNFQIINNVSSS